MKKLIELSTQLFPFWLLVFCGLALWTPEWFRWFDGIWIKLGLAGIMLGMGLTLVPEDFIRVAKMPVPVLLGVVLQYTVMPFLGWSIGYLLGLPAPLAVGLAVVSACPGGTASNVISYLAKGDVALSVSMTSVSTLASGICTPLIALWIIGSRMEVSLLGLVLSTLQVVILPVVLGLLLNRFFHSFTQKIQDISPLFAVFLIAMIVASVIGDSKDILLSSGFLLFLSVFLLHSGGFLMGYLVAWIYTRDSVTARTISIEVGMQNSGLGVVLSKSNFSDPIVAVPSAISSLIHSLIGSFLAAIWRRGQNFKG